MGHLNEDLRGPHAASGLQTMAGNLVALFCFQMASSRSSAIQDVPQGGRGLCGLKLGCFPHEGKGMGCCCMPWQLLVSAWAHEIHSDTDSLPMARYQVAPVVYVI